ncbi:hypothetical protein ACTXJG_12040 [Glutamicibacter arilaitensis]|uniref:hypothetical protein n=1 Tax=Glutamicibacter arilaitensis TaxID=256701 RepID=UPI003FD3B6AF
MESNFRPHISRIYPDVWNTRGGERINGIVLFGFSGIAAHLTPAECFSLADQLVDAAERLPSPAEVIRTEARRRKAQRKPSLHSPRLTAADGTEEPPLETTPAESE